MRAQRPRPRRRCSAKRTGGVGSSRTHCSPRRASWNGRAWMSPARVTRESGWIGVVEVARTVGEPVQPAHRVHSSELVARTDGGYVEQARGLETDRVELQPFAETGAGEQLGI